MVKELTNYFLAEEVRGGRGMEKDSYIIEERGKCRKVMEAYTELYEKSDVLVVEAGKYGFVKLQYFNLHKGFDCAIAFKDSQSMFDDLWEEWYETYLLDFTKGTPMAEMDYGDMFKCLPEEKKKELMDKKICFAEKAGISPDQGLIPVASD